VDPHTAREIGDAVRGAAMLVGVFVNRGGREIARTLDDTGLDLAQLHGADARARAVALGIRAFPAIPPQPPSLAGSFSDLEAAWGVLIEPQPQDGRFGGTGVEWNYAPVDVHPRWFLAGGLRPDNVAAAIRAARPAGVDVASGVESAPGIKDHDLIRRFIAEAHGAFS
jgi:phosphoribosylanthranilate isomerase